MESIKVGIRIRPFLPYENERNTTIETFEEDKTKIILSKNNKRFISNFDRIFPENSTQENIYNFINPILESIYKGINSTILAYGQTGSGKTFTMFGEDFTMNENNILQKLKKDKFNFLIDTNFVVDPFKTSNGIIPRLILDLFKNKNKSIVITCSYIQIYNEKIYDLLIDNSFKEIVNLKTNFDTSLNNNKTEKIIEQENLKIRENKKLGTIIEGALELEANNFYDIFQYLRIGELNRKKRQTNKNLMSSRSHSIFIIYYNNKTEKKISKISLCDLAGSEKYESREKYKLVHLNELKSINKSLSILGNVINCLAKKKKHIPYKDSILTNLLYKCLISKTYLIATISPSDNNFEESLNTLNFADRAHIIQTKLKSNNFEDNYLDGNYDKISIKKLSDELKNLRQLLKIRNKRGNLEPIQEELIKLKEENNNLKRKLYDYNLQNLIKENKYLRKELKRISTSQTPKVLSQNTESNQFLSFTIDNNYNSFVSNNNNNIRYDFSPFKKTNISNKNLYENLKQNSLSNVGKNIISSNNFHKKNSYISYININNNNKERGKSTKLRKLNNIDNINRKIKLLDNLQMHSKMRTELLIKEMENKGLNKKKNNLYVNSDEDDFYN